MNTYLIANIITCICAFIGFIYGIVKFFKPKKAVYAQMITLAGGSMAFCRLYQVVLLLTMACIYHGIFNMLVQSEYKYLGFVLPAVTYIPILYQQYQYYKYKKA